VALPCRFGGFTSDALFSQNVLLAAADEKIHQLIQKHLHVVNYPNRLPLLSHLPPQIIAYIGAKLTKKA
jgi:hypothetical protein